MSRPACRAATRQAHNGSKGNKGWNLLTCELVVLQLVLPEGWRFDPKTNVVVETDAAGADAGEGDQADRS